MPIVGRTWTIQRATVDSPFEAGRLVEVGLPDADQQVIVKYDGGPIPLEWTGNYLASQDKVAIVVSANVYWELVGSEEVTGRMTMFGLSWTTQLPDAMGAWVADPQDSDPLDA